MSRKGVLSPRQGSILRGIRNSITERGEWPTVRQVGECEPQHVGAAPQGELEQIPRAAAAESGCRGGGIVMVE